MNALFYETINKYGYAICQNLHPSQVEKLKKALKAYEQNKSYRLDDSFVKLAFEMILSDLCWQKGKQV